MTEQEVQKDIDSMHEGNIFDTDNAAKGGIKPKTEGHMARPIAPTPTLSGKDAAKFVAATKNPQPFTAPQIDNAKALEAIKQKLLERVAKQR